MSARADLCGGRSAMVVPTATRSSLVGLGRFGALAIGVIATRAGGVSALAIARLKPDSAELIMRHLPHG